MINRGYLGFAVFQGSLTSRDSRHYRGTPGGTPGAGVPFMSKPVVKFTDVGLRGKAFEPQEREFFVRETGNAGFGLRVRPSGHKSFEYVYDFDGRRRRMVLGEFDPANKKALTLAEAHRQYSDAANKRANGIDPIAERDGKAAAGRRERIEAEQRPTVAILARDYLELHAKEKKRTWREDERILNHDVLPAWKNRKAHEITRGDVNRLLDKIKKRGAGIMANRTLALVRKLFNFAIARDELNGQANPATLVERRGVETTRDRYLSDAEIKAHWPALDTARMAASTVAALRLILVTGQRPGEVLHMEWSEIEGEWWTIPESKSKNKRAHRVYLTARAGALLDDMRAANFGDSRWVFPGARDVKKPATVASLSRAVRDWLIEQGVADEAKRWTPHDLRRTCGTNMGRLGISRFIQDRVLNHKDRTIGATYDIYEYADEKRSALERWSAALAVVIEGEQAPCKVVPIRRKA